MFLETERLILRLIQPSDVPALAQLWTDPEVTRYMGGPRDQARLEEMLENDVRDQSSATYDLWPVIEKASSQLVGHCGLLDKDIDGQIEIELIYVFAQSTWGKGYATEMALALKEYAREHLGLHRLVALIDPENDASERVTVKAGMFLEQETTRPGGKIMRLYAVNMET